MATKLYVGGLSYSTTSERLQAHFAQCGQVQSAVVITDRDANSQYVGRMSVGALNRRSRGCSAV